MASDAGAMEIAVRASGEGRSCRGSRDKGRSSSMADDDSDSTMQRSPSQVGVLAEAQWVCRIGVLIHLCVHPRSG
jgi:hypothetical protein